MKKIAFHIQSLLSGGIERVLLELLNELVKTHSSLELLITYEFGDAEVLRHLAPASVRITYLLPISPLTRTHIKKKTGNVSLIEKAAAEVFLVPFRRAIIKKRLAAALVGIDTLVDFDMTLAPFYQMLKGRQTIAYCHFSLAHYYNGNRAKQKRLVDRLLNYNHVVMLCDEMKEEAARIFPVLAPKLVRIYNAVNFKEIRKQAVKSQPDYPPLLSQKKYIVSVGRLQEDQKDFTTLIRAYAIAVEEYKIDADLIIVGDGGSRSMLESLAASLNMQGRIFFAGYQQNPYPWIGKAALFAFSSKFEGLPTVLIEAMALGIPIVATGCPTGVRELVNQGKAGILVPVGDKRALAQGIRDGLNNEALRQSLLAEQASLLPNFSISHNIRAILRLIFTEPSNNQADFPVC